MRRASKAAEIRVRAERKTGELLKATKESGERHDGRQQPKQKLKSADATPEYAPPPPPKQLADLGISKNQSSQWQKLAAIPEEKFNNALANPHVIPSKERGRTFKAAQQTVADAATVEPVIRSESDRNQTARNKTAQNPKGAGRPKGAASKAALAAAIGVSKTTLIEAEQHVETASEFPFMQGDGWREFHVLEAQASSARR